MSRISILLEKDEREEECVQNKKRRDEEKALSSECTR
jgi:hypothetical protein